MPVPYSRPPPFADHIAALRRCAARPERPWDVIGGAIRAACCPADLDHERLHARAVIGDSDDEALDSSDDDSDDGDYATDNNDKTSKDINLTTFKFAADDDIFHKNHHKVSEPEKPKRKKKNPTDPKAVLQATISDPVEGV